MPALNSPLDLTVAGGTQGRGGGGGGALLEGLAQAGADAGDQGVGQHLALLGDEPAHHPRLAVLPPAT